MQMNEKQRLAMKNVENCMNSDEKVMKSNEKL